MPRSAGVASSERSSRRTVVAVSVLVALVLGAVACSSSSGAGTTAAPSSSAAPGDRAAGSTPPGTATPAVADGAPVPSRGCGTSAVAAMKEQRQEVAAGGPDRWFLLTVPPDHDGTTPLPLVLDWHGLMEGAQIHAGMTQFSALAEKEGFVVAFPHGTGTPVRWDANVASNPNLDIEYFDAMLDQLESTLCIDTSRVYSTGLSYGAIMTSTLACLRADKLAAIAPVDGIQLPQPCEPARPLPIWSTHGTADPILLFNGGYGDMVGGLLQGQLAEGSPTTTAVPFDLDGPGYPETVKGWAAKNGCEPTPTDTKLSDEVVKRVYTCPAGRDVEFWVVVGGGHSWPGSAFSKTIERIVGPTTDDFDATATAWEFFQRHQRT